MLLKDVDGDGKLEFLFKDSENKFVYAKPDPANPTGMWIKHCDQRAGPVGEPRHGCRRRQRRRPCRFPERVRLVGTTGAERTGAGEIVDVSSGGVRPWTRSSPGGAEMAVYDVNGDGLNDVVTSLQAHGLGLSWFEQKKAADGARSFVERPIMTDFSTKNAGGVIVLAAARRDVRRRRRRRAAGLHHRQAVLVASRHVHRSRSARGAGAVRLSHRAESQGAGRRGVRARAHPQPFGRRLAPVGRRSQQGRQRRRSSPRPSGARSSSGTTGRRSEAINMRSPCRSEFWPRRRIAAAAVVGAQAPKPDERLAGARSRRGRAAILAAQADQYDERLESAGSSWTYDTPAAVPPPPRSRRRRRKSGRGRTATMRLRLHAANRPGGAGRFPRRGSRRPRRSWSTASCTWRRCTTASSRSMLIRARKSGSRTSATRRRRGASRTGPAPNGIPPQLVFGTADGSSLLISLNAKTGEFTPGFGQGGKVDLRQGVGEKFPKLRVALSSPPAIYKHLAITGNHSQESPSLGPSGDVRAWDLRTGKLVWTFHTIPQARRAEPRRLEERSVGRSRGRQRVGIHHRR